MQFPNLQKPMEKKKANFEHCVIIFHFTFLVEVFDTWKNFSRSILLNEVMKATMDSWNYHGFS